MKDWKKILITPSTSMLMAIQKIDDSAMQIALVVDENNYLIGTVTDGDIRRGILKGVSLDESVQLVMNTHPTVASMHEGRENILANMKRKRLHHVPIVDESGCVVGMEILDELIQSRKRENWVVLMAGGLGSRLRPLTNHCPKPLLKIGNRPLLEIILENFREYGFWQFYLAVNYKAEMVKEYFGDGSRLGVVIRYIYEDKAMGTAGALGLLSEKPIQPIIVMNSDLLTKVNFKQFLNFHLEHHAMATMCIKEYELEIPYGVVKVEKQRLIGIKEKPIQKFFISAGIYVLEPMALDIIPKNEYFDMPRLFKEMIEQGYETAAFPLREYWLDIGQKHDYEKANNEYGELFND